MCEQKCLVIFIHSNMCPINNGILYKYVWTMMNSLSLSPSPSDQIWTMWIHLNPFDKEMCSIVFICFPYQQWLFARLDPRQIGQASATSRVPGPGHPGAPALRWRWSRRVWRAPAWWKCHTQLRHAETEDPQRQIMMDNELYWILWYERSLYTGIIIILASSFI